MLRGCGRQRLVSTNLQRSGASTEGTERRIGKLGYHQSTSPGTTGPARIPVLSGKLTRSVYVSPKLGQSPFTYTNLRSTTHSEREQPGKLITSEHSMTSREFRLTAWYSGGQGLTWATCDSASLGPHQEGLQRSSLNGKERIGSHGSTASSTSGITTATPRRTRPDYPHWQPTLPTHSGNPLEIIMRRRRRGGNMDYSLR